MKRVGEGGNISFTKRISINKSKLLAAEIIFDPDQIIPLLLHFLMGALVKDLCQHSFRQSIC